MPTIFQDKVVIGGSTFNDLPSYPSGAQKWAIDVLDGWHRGPGLDFVLNKVSDVDGAILGGTQSAKEKYLTVGGYVLAPTRAQAEGLMDVLVGTAFPRNKDLTLIRYESVPKFMKVRRISPVEMTVPMNNGFRFIVDLLAADPFKYSLAAVGPFSAGVAGLSSGGRVYPRVYPLVYTTVVSGSENRVVLTNAGTVSSPPTVTLTGPLVKGGWRLSNDTTGEDLGMDVALANGDTMLIDFEQELVYVNGFLVSPNILGDFWRVQPGVNVIKLYADYDPASTFTISTFSAWE